MGSKRFIGDDENKNNRLQSDGQRKFPALTERQIVRSVYSRRGRNAAGRGHGVFWVNILLRSLVETRQDPPSLAHRWPACAEARIPNVQALTGAWLNGHKSTYEDTTSSKICL